MTTAAMPSSSLFFFVIIIIMIISYNYATRKKITWCGTKWTNEKKLVANERTWCCCWMMMINIHWWCVCVWMQSLQNFSWRCHHRSHGFFAYALIIHSGRMVEICCCFFSFVHHHTFIFSFFQYSNIYWQRHILITLMVFFSFKNFNLFNSKCKFTNKQIIMMMNGDNSFFFLPIMLCGC